VFQLKNIGKQVENVQKNILSFIFMMKIIVLIGGGLIKSRLFTTNYDKKRRLGLLVQRAKGFLVRMVKRKKR
jgi:hypothetical protein